MCYNSKINWIHFIAYNTPKYAGKENYNLEAFDYAEQKIKEKYPDAEVYNACRRGLEELGEGKTWDEYLRHDIRVISTCTHIALLHGWKFSKGCKLEVIIATYLNMPYMYQSQEFEIFDPKAKVEKILDNAKKIKLDFSKN